MSERNGGGEGAGNGMDSVVDRNVRALNERRRREAAAQPAAERVAAAIARFCGSMTFIYIHAVFFAVWIVANLQWIPGVPVWDPSFAVLAMVASVEAIFLSTFVLITQNRMAAAADLRADLDLQVGLLIEHELSRVAAVIEGVGKALNVKTDAAADMEALKADIPPEHVLERIERQGKPHEKP